MPVESAIPDYVIDSVRSLPPLPEAVQRLLTLARDPEAEFRDITRVIETDQTLTARVLKVANSALYGVARRVETVRQASVLLGKNGILSIAVGGAVLSLTSKIKEPWPGEPAAFWRHSVGVASMARALAKRLKSQDPESAFVAGLLHDIGKLVMLNHFGGLYAQVLMAAEYGTEPLHLLERQFVETDHAIVGRALCLHWKLPATLTRSVAEHHDVIAPAPGSIADLVRDADDLVKSMAFGNAGNQFVELRSVSGLPHRKMPADYLRQIIVNLPGEVGEAERLLGEDQGTALVAASIRAVMHVTVQSEEQRDLLRVLLLAKGFEPIFIDDAPRQTTDDDLPLAGIITDREPEPAQRIAYAHAGLPILYYGTWREEHAQPLDGFLNVRLLDAWFDEQVRISRPSMSLRLAAVA